MEETIRDSFHVDDGGVALDEMVFLVEKLDKL